MNVNDAAEPEKVDDRLVSIFDKQHALMEKYNPIEAKNGCLQTPDVPVNIHSTAGQARVKDFFWRITEELGEALDAIHLSEGVHAQEELADGLHFLTEVTWLSGSKEALFNFLSTLKAPFTFKPDGDFLDRLFELVRIAKLGDIPREKSVERFILEAGMTCNCLKNKPWKQSQMLTDVPRFQSGIINTWIWYIAICSYSLTPDQLYSFYFKKNQVNQFRQRSSY